MKKILILTSMLFICITSASAQKIAKKEVDKFTKKEIIETSYEKLYKQNLMMSGYTNIFECAIRKVDGAYVMPANILTRDVEKYTEESGVTFLLDNDETVELLTAYTGVSGESYANGYMFNTLFRLSSDDVQKLKNNKVVAIRVSYLGGYYDHDVKGKNQEFISKMIKLVDGE